MRRSVIIQRYKFLDAQEGISVRLAELLYESLVALDSATMQLQCSTLLQLDTSLAPVYQTLHALEILCEALHGAASPLAALEQTARKFAGRPQRGVITHLYTQTYSYYTEKLLFPFLSLGFCAQLQQIGVIFDASAPLLGCFRASMGMVGLFAPVGGEVLLLGRNSYLLGLWGATVQE